MQSGPEQPAAGRCLNCGAELHGAFCADCGQRSVPANPTVAELAGDAWHELSGYDGRIAATFRGLLHPGRLTVDYVQGKRASYLPPVRLYLIASLIYFVTAAAAPDPPRGRGLQIGVTDDSRPNAVLSPQDREELLNDIGDAPWFARPIIRSIAEDPAAFRARIFTVMPRVFFGMLPVLAAILTLLYRGRRFPVSLVFAAHVHTAAYLLFAVAAAVRFSGSEVVDGVVGTAALLGFVVYALRSLREVFGGGWTATTGKAMAAAFLYVLASVPAFVIILIWASLV